MRRFPRAAAAALIALSTTAAGVSSPVAAASVDRGDAPRAVGEHAASALIVEYRSATPEAASDNAAAADVARKSIDRGHAYRMERRMTTGEVVVDLGGTLRGAELDRVIARFRADRDVVSAVVDEIFQPMAYEAPNDPEYAKQWDLFEEKAGMNVPGGWAKATGKGVTVAVIDTGYVKHSDLEPNIVAGYDFISSPSTARDGDGRDPNPTDEGDWYEDGECGRPKGGNSTWHGTHVAGTVAAAANNANGVAGIAYDAKIQPIRVLGKCGGQGSDIADAIIWASGGDVRGVPKNTNPAQVINLSLGSAQRCTSINQKAIDIAVRNGTTVVVAAGNSNADVAGFNPGSCKNIISVASSSRAGDRAFYSNFGELIDIAAPGGQVRNESDTPGSQTTPENGILSTVNAGLKQAEAEALKPMMGTSMAAPHIAGLAALLAGQGGLTPAAIEQRIKDTARPLPGTCTGGCGAGLADTAKAVGADPVR